MCSDHSSSKTIKKREKRYKKVLEDFYKRRWAHVYSFEIDEIVEYEASPNQWRTGKVVEQWKNTDMSVLTADEENSPAFIWRRNLHQIRKKNGSTAVMLSMHDLPVRKDYALLETNW